MLSGLMSLLDVQQIPDAYKRARRLHSAGQFDAAEALYRQILTIRPQTTEAHYQLARLYGRKGQPAKALRSFEKAIAQKPGEAAIWTTLTETLLEWRDSSRVIKISDRLVRAGQARAVLALLTKLADRFLKQSAADLALPIIRQTLKIAPGRPDLLTMLGDALSFLHAPDAALSSYDKAIAAAPDADFPKIQKAVLLQTLGRFDDAELLLHEALEQAPDNGRLFRLLTSGKKMTAGDPLIARMQETFAKTDLEPADRIPLGFALAKAFEDIGAFDRVFPVLNVANGLVRKTFPYDIRTRVDQVENLVSALSGDGEGRVIPGTARYAPIFVTGMPRSGTTLVGRIVAAHSLATDAGEAGVFSRLAENVLRRDDGGYRALADIPDSDIAAAGHAYEAEMRRRFPNAVHVVDKSIMTYNYLPFLRLALPNARLVVVRRDPRDALLSIYKNLFREGTHLYAYDLKELGIYHKLFERLIGTWHKVMPDGFYEIRYEDIVTAAELWSRALIRACGLEWEDGCLSFHARQSSVRTLSLHQVRQPVYASSLESWRRYELDLRELFDALEA